MGDRKGERTLDDFDQLHDLDRVEEVKADLYGGRSKFTHRERKRERQTDRQTEKERGRDSVLRPSRSLCDVSDREGGGVGGENTRRLSHSMGSGEDIMLHLHVFSGRLSG